MWYNFEKGDDCMTEKIKKMLEQLKNKKYKNLRKSGEIIKLDNKSSISEYFDAFRKLADNGNYLIFEYDDFGFNRGIDSHIGGSMGNLTVNYERVITNGLDFVKKQIEDRIEKEHDEEKIRYGKTMLDYISICFDVCDKYKNAAEKAGNMKLYNALRKIPHNGAETFYEACLFLKICVYFLRAECTAHIGFGRFDQYMHPFYLHDKEAGISDEEIFETLESFFISINYDTDLYHGVIQGDNGQSLVLGGFDENGNSMYNELSHMCMKASLDLNLIDPKINLRVGKNTPDEIYEFATLLTKQGMGFPQYCNDDVVVPGLVKLGYEKKDALNYVVAACWEYIIPGCGGDYPNIAVFDFPKVINDVIVSEIKKCETFDSLTNEVRIAISKTCDNIVNQFKTIEFSSRPLTSAFTDGCIETLTDIWHGGTKYQNFGSHGAGISNAADALAAVKENIYDKKTIDKDVLLQAISDDFNGYEDIRIMLKNSPKMGNADVYVDNIAYDLMKTFSENLNNRDNGKGGIWRAGTGSAMEYIFKGKECEATVDGRKAFTPYSSSFSPSLNVKTDGLTSVIRSFTGFNMTEIINGGPLTIEVHDSILKSDEGIKKIAMLVKSFVLLGGHQLQINSVNRETLIDAQKNPENYPGLIVRVWGWSGYFTELDEVFQNHIISRTEYTK